MMMLTTAASASTNGATLRAELAAAGLTVGEFDFSLSDGVLSFPTLDESDRATVESVVAAHDGSPVEPAEVTADREFRAAVEAATSIADLRAALLGAGGKGRAAARPAS